MAARKVNLEKIGIYLAAAMAFWTILNAIMDLRDRITKIEGKIEHLEKVMK